MSSCGNESSASLLTPQGSFSVHMKAKKGEALFEADIDCFSYNDITLTFTYPEELSGFAVSSSENAYIINIFGVNDIMSEEEISKTSLLNILFNTIRISVFSNHGQFKKADSGFSAALTVDDIPISVTFSEDGYLTSISAEAINFSAEFQKSG